MAGRDREAGRVRTYIWCLQRSAPAFLRPAGRLFRAKCMVLSGNTLDWKLLQRGWKKLAGISHGKTVPTIVVEIWTGWEQGSSKAVVWRFWRPLSFTFAWEVAGTAVTCFADGLFYNLVFGANLRGNGARMLITLSLSELYLGTSWGWTLGSVFWELIQGLWPLGDFTLTPQHSWTYILDSGSQSLAWR